MNFRLASIKKRLKKEFNPIIDDWYCEKHVLPRDPVVEKIKRERQEKERLRLELAENQKEQFYCDIEDCADRAIQNGFRELFFIKREIQPEVREILLDDSQLLRYFIVKIQCLNRCCANIIQFEPKAASKEANAYCVKCFYKLVPVKKRIRMIL